MVEDEASRERKLRSKIYLVAAKTESHALATTTTLEAVVNKVSYGLRDGRLDVVVEGNIRLDVLDRWPSEHHSK